MTPLPGTAAAAAFEAVAETATEEFAAGAAGVVGAAGAPGAAGAAGAVGAGVGSPEAPEEAVTLAGGGSSLGSWGGEALPSGVPGRAAGPRGTGRGRGGTWGGRNRGTVGGVGGAAVEGAPAPVGSAGGRWRVIGYAKEEGESETWLERVRKQVDFYFSDANLRRDDFMRQKCEEGDGYVALAQLLQFNRIRDLRCKYLAQLVQAVRKSEMLSLSDDKTKVRRNLAKMPIEEVDPVPRTVYVEGMPLTFSVDDIALFFARHGRVCLVELPRHRATREPRGFCFVEFASEDEATATARLVDGTWPPLWPQRFDGRFLRVLPKHRWLELKAEYSALKRSARGSNGAVVPTEAPTESASSSTAAAVASTAPALFDAPPAAAASGGASGGEVRLRRACLVRITGFPQPQTVLSLRQFVEHAVSVEYCDFLPGASAAHLRLRSPEECRLLLEDLRLSRRMLGWLQPEVCILTPEEEDKYWTDVERRRAQRDAAETRGEGRGPAPAAEDAAEAAAEAAAAAAPSKRAARRLLRPLRGLPENPQGVVHGGPVTSSTVQRWRTIAKGVRVGVAAKKDFLSLPVGAAGREKRKYSSSGFVDTVCGNGGGVQAGFARPRKLRRRGPRRKEPLPKAAAGAAPEAAAAAQPNVPPRRARLLPPPPPPPPKSSKRSAAGAGVAGGEGEGRPGKALRRAAAANRGRPFAIGGGGFGDGPLIPPPSPRRTCEDMLWSEMEDITVPPRPSVNGGGGVVVPPPQRGRGRGGVWGDEPLLVPPSPVAVPCAKPKRKPAGLPPSMFPPQGASRGSRTPQPLWLSGGGGRMVPPPSPVALRPKPPRSPVAVYVRSPGRRSPGTGVDDDAIAAAGGGGGAVSSTNAGTRRRSMDFGRDVMLPPASPIAVPSNDLYGLGMAGWGSGGWFSGGAVADVFSTAPAAAASGLSAAILASVVPGSSATGAGDIRSDDVRDRGGGARGALGAGGEVLGGAEILPGSVAAAVAVADVVLVSAALKDSMLEDDLDDILGLMEL